MSIEYTCEEQQQFWEVESGLWLLFMLMSTDIHVFPAGRQLLANAAHSVSSLHQPPSGPWKSLFFSLFSSELICLRPIRDVSRKYFSSPISKICGDRYRSPEWWYCQSLYCSQIPILSGIIFFWDKVWGVGLSGLKDSSHRLGILLLCWWRLHYCVTPVMLISFFSYYKF